MNIFDHLNNITLEKKDFKGEEGWNIYMINRYLSMSEGYVEIVNIVQKNVFQRTPEQVYNIYRDIIPKRKIWLQYIKSKSEKFDPELLGYVAQYYECSEREAKQYIPMLKNEQLKDILEGFGLDKKQIKAIL